MAIYEYETKQGIVRAMYQTGTTNSSGGYFENFMGDRGTLMISESADSIEEIESLLALIIPKFKVIPQKPNLLHGRLT